MKHSFYSEESNKLGEYAFGTENKTFVLFTGSRCVNRIGKGYMSLFVGCMAEVVSAVQ